jgi:hypothetical protein
MEDDAVIRISQYDVSPAVKLFHVSPNLFVSDSVRAEMKVRLAVRVKRS